MPVNPSHPSPPRPVLQNIALGVVLGAFVASTAWAGGFSLPNQGAKAMGMAGAFVAQADDATAIFYNPAGIALQDEKKGALGISVDVLNESLYQGFPSGIGSGTTGEQDVGTAFPPHVYAIMKLGANTKFGIGLTTPFHLDTAWANPDTFAGRGITTAAELQTWDATAVFSMKCGEALGLAAGVIYRTSELSHGRRLIGTNPFTNEDIDIASINLESDSSDGLGYTAGVLVRPNDRFSLGLSYRSAIDITYTGVGTLSQIASGSDQLDSFFRAIYSFDEQIPAGTSIEMPEEATVGVALGITPALMVEVDVTYTGWSSFETLNLAFPTDSSLNIAIPQMFDDSVSVRAGLQYTTATGTQFRVGAAYDESPQGDSTVGPLLVDANRTIFAAGFSKDWLDLAVQWVDREQRIIDDQVDTLNGNYRSSAYALAFTLGM